MECSMGHEISAKAGAWEPQQMVQTEGTDCDLIYTSLILD